MGGGVFLTTLRGHALRTVVESFSCYLAVTHKFDEILIKFLRLPLLVELEIYAKTFSWQKAKNFVLLLLVCWTTCRLCLIFPYKKLIYHRIWDVYVVPLRSDNDLRLFFDSVNLSLESMKKKKRRVVNFYAFLFTIIYFPRLLRAEANINKSSFQRIDKQINFSAIMQIECCLHGFDDYISNCSASFNISPINSEAALCCHIKTTFIFICNAFHL